MDQETSEDRFDKIYGTTAVQAKLGPGERKKIIDDKIKYLEGAAQVIQNELVAFQKKYNKFFQETLELYKVLYKPDVLFDDSPLSKHTMNRWLRLFLIKKDMAFLAKDTHWFDSPSEIPDFLAKTKELKNWTSRFSHDEAPERSGEDKILS